MGIWKTISARIDEDPEYRANLYQLSTMSRTKEPTTIAAILELTPGDKENPCWVNGEFTASVNEAKANKTQGGADFVSGTLVDPDTGASIAFSWFGRKAFPPAGSIVLIGGQGNRLTEYKEEPQIQFGSKTTVNVVSRPTGATPSAARTGSHTQTTPAQNRAANASGTAVLGQTVGMALNNACHFVLEEVKDPAASGLMVGTPDFYRRIWKHASAIIRISRVLEKGVLAPNPDEPEPGIKEAAEVADEAIQTGDTRNDQQPEPRRRVQPTDDGSAFGSRKSAAVDEEEVPF